MPKRAVTSARMERLQIEFKLHYQKVCNDIGKESLALDCDEFRIYDWRNPKRSYNLPAFMLMASSVSNEMLEFIQNYRKNNTVYDLNGSMDDEWRKLTNLFSLANKQFMEGREFNPRLAEALKKELNQLLEEWKAVGVREVDYRDFL